MWNVLPVFETLQFKNPQRREASSIRYIAIHHTASSPRESAEAIHNFHLSKGWSGIGYHYIARPYAGGDGLYIMEKVRPVLWVPACVKGYNTQSVCVALAGNYSEQVPNEEFLRRVAMFVAFLASLLEVRVENVLGHREFPGQATECPGKYIDMREFRQHVAQKIVGKVET